MYAYVSKWSYRVSYLLTIANWYGGSDEDGNSEKPVLCSDVGYTCKT